MNIVLVSAGRTHWQYTLLQAALGALCFVVLMGCGESPGSGAVDAMVETDATVDPDADPDAIWRCDLPADSVVVSHSYNNLTFPEAIWTGQGGLVVWTRVPPTLQEGDVVLQRLSSTGSPEGDPVLAAEQVFVDRAHLVWTGEHVIVFWLVPVPGLNDAVYARAYTLDLVALGPAQLVTDAYHSETRPRGVWTGDEVLLYWMVELEEDSFSLVLSRLDAQGQPIGQPAEVAVGESPPQALAQ